MSSHEFTVRQPSDKNPFWWVVRPGPEGYVAGNGHKTEADAQAAADSLNAEARAARTIDGMEFQMVDDAHATCRSQSGRTYTLTGRPIPDEYDSAVRCGIDPGDPFVTSIPLVWSCDCAAGKRGRDCKHARTFVQMRNR